MTGEIGQLQFGMGSDLFRRCVGPGVFATYHVFVAGQNQIDHAREIDGELGLMSPLCQGA